MPKLVHGRWPGVSCPLGRSAVLADQAAKDLHTPDPGGDIGRVAGPPLRRFLLQPLVWTVAVIVPGVLRQDAAELPLAEDKHVLQALAPQRSRKPLGVGVGPHRQRHPIQMIGTDVCG